MSQKRHLFVFDGDGPSDRALKRLLELLIHDCAPELLFDLEWVNPTFTPARSLRVADRVSRTVKLYPSADVILLHRDAEREPLDVRTAEIEAGVKELRERGMSIAPTIAVVPVRMQEAWLLVSETAIREAAGRPRGTVPLNLPSVDRVEALADPKAVLCEALDVASETTGRRRRAFRAQRVAGLVSEYIHDLAPLRQLVAFRVLEERLRAVLA